MRGSNFFSVVVGAVLAFGFLALPAASATPMWSSPFSVATMGTSYGPVVAGSLKRGATVAWWDGGTDAVWARRIAANGRLGPERMISRRGEFLGMGPWLGVDPSGSTVIVWCPGSYSYYGCRSLETRRMSATGRLGPIRVVGSWRTPAIDIDARVAMDATGRATIAWSKADGVFLRGPGNVLDGATVRARRFGLAGTLGPVLDIATGEGINLAPRVAALPDGRTMVAWRSYGEHASAVRSRTVARNGALSATRDIAVTRAVEHDIGFELAADARGTATFAWLEPVLDGTRLGLMVRRMSADSAHRPVRTIVAGAWAYDPRLALDRRGNATLVWRQPELPSDVYVRRLSRSGALSASAALSPPSLRVATADLAVDPSGRATVVWGAAGSDVFAPTNIVQARQTTVDGRLGAMRTLNSPSPTGMVADVHAVFSGPGAALVVWGDSGGKENKVKAARRAVRGWGSQTR